MVCKGKELIRSMGISSLGLDSCLIEAEESPAMFPGSPSQRQSNSKKPFGAAEPSRKGQADSDGWIDTFCSLLPLDLLPCTALWVVGFILMQLLPEPKPGKQLWLWGMMPAFKALSPQRLLLQPHTSTISSEKPELVADAYSWMTGCLVSYYNSLTLVTICCLLHSKCET